MRRTIFLIFATVGLIAIFSAAGVVGQTAKSDVRENIVVIEQPDCPMRLIPAPTSERPYLLKFSNAGDRVVRAFVLVKEHPRYDGVEVKVTGVPIAPGKDMNWTIGVISNTTLSFDYVLYEDGTSWGPNKFERSNEIANVLAARAAVMARVTELAHGYSDPDDFAVMQRDFGGLSSYDAAGPPNPLKREQHILGAWNMAILKLRSNRRRPIEANELADKLEVERPRISIESKAKVEPLSHAKP